MFISVPSRLSVVERVLSESVFRTISSYFDSFSPDFVSDKVCFEASSFSLLVREVKEFISETPMGVHKTKMKEHLTNFTMVRHSNKQKQKMQITLRRFSPKAASISR